MAQQTLLRGGSVIHPGGQVARTDVLVEDGVIREVGPSVSAPEGAQTVHLADLTLAPGFIDVHVHGGGGFSLITTDPEHIRAYARWAVSHGVTSFLATICADSLEAGIECAHAAAVAAGSVEDGATLLGLNFEGPFVSPDRRGALPPEWLTEPDLRMLGRLLAAGAGSVRLMTVAPELPGASAVIGALRDAGVRVSVGHTDAKYEQAKAAFEAGASHVTHAFNAMRPLHHREPGPLGAALDSPGVTVEVIADGVHLHPAAVHLLVRAFGSARVCLVTDAVRPAGLDSGTFDIGGQQAKLDGGSIRLPDGTIAGSAATMDALVRNLVEWGIADLATAVTMASATPARVVGCDGTKGSIAPGYDADLVALTDDGRVAATWIGGRLVYEAPDGIIRLGQPSTGRE